VSVGLQPWVCPLGTVANTANQLKTPPSNTDCCLVRALLHVWGCLVTVMWELIQPDCVHCQVNKQQHVCVYHATATSDVDNNHCSTFSLQPTCADRDVNRRGNQTWPCPAGTAFNMMNAAFNPPSNAACCTGQVRQTFRKAFARHCV
jgi:hypothetical protein